jgi:pyruvate-formate lyase-activating enzyme
MLKLADVRQIQIELTTKCNARCPMCMRNYRGIDYNAGYPLCELSLSDFKKILTPEVLAGIMRSESPVNGRVPINYNFQGIIFNGNLGDFSNAKDAADIVEYLAEHNVQVCINTNGSTRTPDWWARLARPKVSVGFALDGLADTHHLYRQDTDWHKIIANAKAFIAAGGHAIWRFIPFDHNQHQQEACEKLSSVMGFARFENIHDGRNRTAVFKRNGEFSHHIGKSFEPNNQIPNVQYMMENHLTWYDSQTFRSEKDSATLNLQCTHKLSREIYIAADGSVYPCCYLGFYPKTMFHPGNKELAPMVNENNALEHPLQDCLEWFESIEQSWAKDSIRKGRTYKCITTCNQKAT